MNRNKKLANMAMLVALAMIFSYVEKVKLSVSCCF
mgnify:CR=1 FL=1